jgi:cell division protein FtsB
VKWFASALVAALLLLQYRIWFSSGGVGEVLRLRTAVAGQEADNQRLSGRNAQLSAEVHDLKQGFVALEERARSDLGMIGPNETFYQVGPAGVAPPVVPRDPSPSAPTAPSAPGGASGTHTAAR